MLKRVKKYLSVPVQYLMPVISALGRLRGKGQELEGSLIYIVGPVSRKQRWRNRKKKIGHSSSGEREESHALQKKGNKLQVTHLNNNSI